RSPAGLADDVADVEDANHRSQLFSKSSQLTADSSQAAAHRGSCELRAVSCELFIRAVNVFLLCVIHRAHLADDSHLDLTGVLQLRLDLARDVLRQPDRLLVG